MISKYDNKKITTNILRSVLFLPERYSNKPNLTEAYLVILPTSSDSRTLRGMIHPHRCPKKTSGGRGWWWPVAAVGEFFHGFKKTGKWKHLEMIDWDWDWIWDWDRLESVSNYLPRPELLPRWLWVAACLDFHDIQGGNFPEFVSNRIHVVSVHIIFFAKIKNMFFPKSNQNSRNKLPWTFLHHTPIFVRPQFRCFSPLGSW